MLISPLLSALVATTVFAEEPSSRVSIVDSSFSLRARNQHDNNGVLTKNQIQYNVDLKLQFRLDKDGKWKLISRTKTGSSFESGWNDAGIGNNSKFADDLNVRQFFVQYESGSTTASAGFLPIVASSDLKGVFSYDEDGWIDGARLKQTNLSKWANKVSVTVGRIDDLSKPSILARGIDTPNVIQVHVQGNLTKRIAYALEGTQFDPENAESEQYLRLMVEIATTDILGFVKKVVIEPLLQNSDKPLQGFALSAHGAISKSWAVSGTYSYKGRELTAGEKLYAPREDFYREGHQASLQITKKFEGAGSPELSLAVGKALRGPRKDPNFNIGPFNKSGLRVETKLKIKF